MFLRLKPFLYSLVFLLSLELISFRADLVFLIAVIFFFISLFTGKKLGGRWLFSILPAFFTIFSVALLYLISDFTEQQIFILLAFFMYYLACLGAFRLGEYKGDLTARGMIMAASMATIFFAFTASYGFYLNFLVPLYSLMIVYLVVALLVSYQYFRIINDNKKSVWIYSFLLALIMAELIWTMDFWPFGYLTTGVIALILYYVLWDLAQSYFLNLLSRKRVVANMVFFSVLIILVLLSSKWLPVI